ncbi:MAG: DUF4112 domain-containing protein [Ferruginibacter sp.]
MAIAVIQNKALEDMDKLAKLMDSRFRIPGTDIRFGLDAIMGLVPGVGDFSSMAVSGYMLIVLMRNGASGFLLARMVFNVLLDMAVGSIPFLGDIFDVAFKANTKNMRLMKQHYTEGKHTGSAWKLILPVLLLLLAFFTLVIWGMYKLITWIF